MNIKIYVAVVVMSPSNLPVGVILHRKQSNNSNYTIVSKSINFEQKSVIYEEIVVKEYGIDAGVDNLVYAFSVVEESHCGGRDRVYYIYYVNDSNIVINGNGVDEFRFFKRDAYFNGKLFVSGMMIRKMFNISSQLVKVKLHEHSISATVFIRAITDGKCGVCLLDDNQYSGLTSNFDYAGCTTQSLKIRLLQDLIIKHVGWQIDENRLEKIFTVFYGNNREHQYYIYYVSSDAIIDKIKNSGFVFIDDDANVDFTDESRFRDGCMLSLILNEY